MAAAQWSQLPRDLLRLIGKRLNTRIDTLHFRSVCSSWRSSVPPFNRTPITLPFPISPNPALHKDRRGYFSLSESPIYFFLPENGSNPNPKSCPIWLLRVEEKANGKFHPLNPLSRIATGEEIGSFPKDFPNVLNLLNVRVIEIGKGFSLEFVETSENIDRTFAELKSLLIIKVVVSSLPCTLNGNDFAVLALHGGKLGFIKVGDESWRSVDGLNKYEDMVYYKGKFYAVDYKWKTVVVVFGAGMELEVKEVVPSLPYFSGGQRKFLVGSSEGLFLIDKHMVAEGEVSFDFRTGHYSGDEDSESHLNVYKLNEESHEWESVYSIGDNVFFVGDDCCYSVSARDFPGLKRNCIYFLDDTFTGDNEELGDLCVDAGVFRMADSKCGALQTFKAYSKLIWPPPAWLKAKK